MHIIEIHKEQCDTSFQQNNFDERLDRSKWRHPLVSIVVTHFNYSDHVKDALLSVLDQTHPNWECVVVDDASTPEHQFALEQIVNNLGSEKIRLLKLSENVGQVRAFFAGLDVTGGAFVCLLDPDDRYDPTFLEEGLRAHLNETIMCPIMSCDQRLLQNGSLISGVVTWHKLRFLEKVHGINRVPAPGTDHLLYFPPDITGWFWTTTSALMFRRSALDLIRPHKTLAYKRAADSYLAQGSHYLGGTLFLTKPLIYRGVHDANGWLGQTLFATRQKMNHSRAEDRALEACDDAIAAIQHNGGTKYLERNGALRALKAKKNRSAIRRWGRSIQKRWHRLMANVH